MNIVGIIGFPVTIPPGSKFSIMHPQNGADHKPNKIQRWAFAVWNKKFLPDVERILETYNPDYVHLSEIGDLGELDYKNRNAEEVWTRKDTDIVENHARLLEPLYNMVDSVHFVRGTKAHIGEDGGIDEKIAEDCNKTVATNEKTSDGNKVKAGWYAEFTLSGVHFDIAHHGKNRSKWTDINGLTSLGNEILLKRAKNGQKIPDVVSRGHYHYGEHTPYDKKPYVVSLPSWQLPNTFVFRIDPTTETPHIGGHVIIVKDGKIIYAERLRYFSGRNKIQCLMK